MVTTRATGSEPVLSMVIPTYNVEPWLDDCLNSLVAQDLDQEIIVVLDAPTDGSARIAREFRDRYPSVVLIENETNLGPGAARNAGLRRARGRYVTFPDSDDVVPDGAYAAMIASLERTGSDFVTARADEFGRQNGRTRYWTLQHDVYDTGAERTTLAEHPELIYDHTVWTKVYRTGFLHEQQITWPEGTLCEDVVPCTRSYTAASSIDVLPRTAYLYRRRPGSITTTLDAQDVLADWAHQTAEALRIVRESKNAAALQVFVEKIMLYEVGNRVGPLGETTDPTVRALALAVIRDVVGVAEPSTLRRVPGTILETTSRVLGGMDDATSEDQEGLGDLSVVPEVLLRALGRHGGVASGGPVGPGARASGSAPALSVILPTHDVAPWVDECVRSILAQDMADFELLCVDDHSTDGTWEKLQAWAARDPRVIAVRSPGRGGAQARNAAIELATGTYLAFCDGDDLVPRGAYATMLSTATSSGAEVTIGGFQKFYASTTWSNLREYGLDRPYRRTTIDLVPRLVRNRTCWNRLIRRDFWTRHRLHFPTTPRGNDIAPMSMAMRRAEHVAITPEIVYHYRARPGTSSMTASLSSVASAVGYLAQERVCAVVLADDPASDLAREYWHMALGVDGWSTVGKLLGDDVARLTQLEREAIVSAISDLVVLAPLQAVRRIGPRRALIYHLMTTGDLETARQVWMRETEAVDKHAAETIAWMAAALTTGLDSGFDRESAARVFHADVLRPFMDRVVPWEDDLADVVCRFVARSGLDVADVATPGTNEERVFRAMASGDHGTLWRQVTHDSWRFLPRFRAEVADVKGRTVVLRGEPLPDGVALHRLEVVGSRGRQRNRRVRVVGNVVTGSGGWCMDADLSRLEAGWDWQARVIAKDALGRVDVPLHITWPSASTTSAVRPLSQDGAVNGFRTYKSGAARLARAVEWRVERMRKARSAAGSKGAQR